MVNEDNLFDIDVSHYSMMQPHVSSHNTLQILTSLFIIPL